MSFDSLLIHDATIWRNFADGTEDEWGQPVTAPDIVNEDWPCRIDPMTEREKALTSNAGAVIGDHRVFGWPTDVREGDYLVTSDDRAFQITSNIDAGGHGHHIELIAREVTSPALAVPS